MSSLIFSNSQVACYICAVFYLTCSQSFMSQSQIQTQLADRVFNKIRFIKLLLCETAFHLLNFSNTKPATQINREKQWIIKWWENNWDVLKAFLMI